ncbi:sterol desaturase family protein [Luminiphilus sp.]|nr:sterol desaturase family protein [Luminiphilus sp.]
MSGFEALSASLLDAMFVVADPGKRLYWMHVLSAALLALIYCRCAARRQSIADLASSVLDSAYWWNRSTRLDYGLFALNNFLKVAMFAPVLGGQVAVSLVVTKFLHFNIAESHLFVWPPIAITVAFTMVAFLFDDFMRFVVHWLMHRVPILWHFHRLHHTATTLTPFTVHRTHPVESFINSSRAVLSLGLVSGVFVWLFGHGLQVWDILGVNALGFVMTLAGSNLRHSHIPLHFGLAESLLISPAQHQLHHSVDHNHPNLGSFLSWWDRLCGSWMAGREARDLRFGLSTGSSETSANTYPDEGARAASI